MNQEYDVIVVGRAPLVYLPHWNLPSKRANTSILLVDMGRTIDHRNCPARTLNRCVRCHPCNIMSGWAGAGAFSDGKLSLSEEVGGHIVGLPAPPARCATLIRLRRYHLSASTARRSARPRPQRSQGGRDSCTSATRLQHPPHPLPGAPFGHRSTPSTVLRDMYDTLMRCAPASSSASAPPRDGLLGGGRHDSGRRLHDRPGRASASLARATRRWWSAPGRGGAAWLTQIAREHDIETHQQRSGHRRARRGAQFRHGPPRPAPLTRPSWSTTPTLFREQGAHLLHEPRRIWSARNTMTAALRWSMATAISIPSCTRPTPISPCWFPQVHRAV